MTVTEFVKKFDRGCHFVLLIARDAVEKLRHFMDGLRPTILRDTLEDMLLAYVIDFKSVWQSYIPLVEFAYNNSYESSIQMAPFEALYERRCIYPLYWDDVDRAAVTGPEMIHEMEHKVKLIQERLKSAQDRQAAYANKRRRPLEFQQGDRLRKYKPDPSHVLDISEIQLVPDVSYVERPVCILDRYERKLRSKLMSMLKVITVVD
ncbi:uncharacterized protein LOC142528334 [Primulina tabacum]|uniref:uncharacterized protein LOC142528334 n=1 Tax=Primulina tabacum TaxID=48773 RepID=UPI003F596BEA